MDDIAQEAARIMDKKYSGEEYNLNVYHNKNQMRSTLTVGFSKEKEIFKSSVCDSDIRHSRSYMDIVDNEIHSLKKMIQGLGQ